MVLVLLAVSLWSSRGRDRGSWRRRRGAAAATTVAETSDLRCCCRINRRAALLSWGWSGIKRRHETGGEGLAVQRRDGGMISRCKRFGRRRDWGAIEAVVVTGPGQWICLHDETLSLDALSGSPNPPGPWTCLESAGLADPALEHASAYSLGLAASAKGT